MFTINDINIKPTIFPDRTSQIWKLPESLFLLQTININWYFDSEGELIHLAQIVDLFRSTGPRVINLYIDYLPYARQDKPVSNNTTFALHSFMKLLSTLELDKVTVLDPHSDVWQRYGKFEKRHNDSFEYIKNTIKLCNPDAVCYPDAGARIRYDWYGLISDRISAEKIRNQRTGELSDCKIYGDVLNKSILIIDDICDGGKTFINLAQELKAKGAKEINLYVTHGIFSNGLGILFQNEIKRIFTKNGEYFQGNVNYNEYGTPYKPWSKM